MEKKRVSMREIARACGCSVATVSYVLNHSGKAKISSSTRLRVIETAKRLNYSLPRQRGVRPGRAVIVVSALPGQGAGRRAALMDLAGHIAGQLAGQGLPAWVAEAEHLAQCWAQVQQAAPSVIFLLDRGSGGIALLDPPCVQPVIFVDSDNDDPLYYKVLPDYPSLVRRGADLLGEPRPLLLIEGVRSSGLLHTMTRGLDPEDVFVNLGDSLEAFLAARQGRKAVVVGDLLAVQACRFAPPGDLAVISALDCPGLFPPEMTVLPVPNRARAAAAVKVAMDLLALDYEPGRSHRVLLPGGG